MASSGTHAGADEADRHDGETLVGAAMRGDAGALSTLWEQNRRWIAAVLLAHKPVFEDLDDLLQEVAVTLVSKIDTLREETNVRAWLRTVAINAARASGRSSRYRPRPESSISPGGIEDRAGHEDDPDKSDEVSDLLERLDRLPEGYREPLLLRVSKGLRSKQIAELLDLPPATIDTRIARARRMLRESGSDDDAESIPFQPRIVAMRRGDEAV